MAGDCRPTRVFAAAFAEELGKWAARVLIAAIVALAGGFILLPFS
jgi:hypothetical protein